MPQLYSIAIFRKSFDSFFSLAKRCFFKIGCCLHNKSLTILPHLLKQQSQTLVTFLVVEFSKLICFSHCGMWLFLSSMQRKTGGRGFLQVIQLYCLSLVTIQNTGYSYFAEICVITYIAIFQSIIFISFYKIASFLSLLKDYTNLLVNFFPIDEFV